MKTSAPVEVLSRRSPSRLAEVYRTEEFQLAWDNSVSLHVARNLLRLRRFRQMSQAAVASAMETSQSAVARIEGGEENFTIETLQRFIRALNGRFQVSITPEEVPALRLVPWWETVPEEPEHAATWTARGVVWRRTAETDQVIVALERPRGTQPRAENQIVIAEAAAS